MKRAILYILAAVLMVGCKENARQGELRIEGLGIAVEQEILKLSAAPSKIAEPATEPMEVIIIDATGKEVVRYPSHLTMPTTTPLHEGSYTLRVCSSNSYTGVEIDKPLYGASRDFVITAGEVTTVSIVCTETTASVKVEYNDLFKIVYPATKYRYWAELTSSNGTYISFRDYPNQTAFFNITSPDVSVYCQIFMEQLQSDGATWIRIWGNKPPLDPANPLPNEEKAVIYTIPDQDGAGLVPAKGYVLTVQVTIP